MASSIWERGKSLPKKAPVAGKPRELEDGLNFYVYHPLSRRLARALVSTRITPNMVSVAGGLLVVAAGFAYTGLGWPIAIIVGFGLHALWHVVDGADGDLARMTGKASPMGEFVDGACDYASHFFLYLILSLSVLDQVGWPALLIALFAGLSRIAQANHAESQRRTYLWRVYGVPWLKQTDITAPERPVRQTFFTRIAAPVSRAYVALAAALSPAEADLDRLFERSMQPEERERLSRLSRYLSRRSLPLQGLLGANYRTILLAVSMAAGSPLPFFLVEATLLNLLLVLSVGRQTRCNRQLAAHLERRTVRSL